MDLKALMQKLETINTKQIVTESVETKQVITESVAIPARRSADPVFTSSIARSLAEEFGYALDEADPNDPNATAATAANTKKMQANVAAKDAASGKTVGSGTTPAPAGQAASPAAAPAAGAPAAGAPAAGGVANPYQGADAAKFAAMSPADQAWLTKGGGKPDINDQFILARAPNKGAAVAKPAAAAAPGVAGSTNATAAADNSGNVAAPAGGQAASPAKPAEVPAGINPETGEKYTSVADAPLELPPGAEPEAGMTVAGDKAKPAGGQAASPAAAKPAYKADPVGQSIASQLKMTSPDAIKLFQKNNGLAADGQIGPATTKALQAAAQKMGLTTTSGVGTSTAGAGRGGQGGATATQMAQAPAAGGQAASPAANPKTAELDAKLAGLKKYPQMNAQIIARLEKEKAALTGGSTQTPAQQAVNKDIGNFAGESIVTQDDAILAMIRNIRV